MASWTAAQSPTSNMTSPDSPKCISSTASQDGQGRSTSPDGTETDLFGAPLSPAKVSAPQDSKRDSTTSEANYGSHSSPSSESIALCESLANKCRQRFDLVGSIEYAQTWKRKVTPSGFPYWEHTASARPTGDSGSTGWRTPDSNQRGGAITDPEKVLSRIEKGHQVNLEDQACLVGWPTPQVCTGPNNSENRGKDHGGERARMTPQNVPDLVGWPTASARDWKDTPGMSTTGTNPDGSERTRLDQLPRVAALAGWVSPTAQDHSRGDKPPRPHDRGVPLSQQVAMVKPWATPRAEDAESSGMRHSRGVADTLTAQTAPWPTPNTMEGGQTSRGGSRKDELLMGGLVQDAGTTSTSSPAETEKPEGSSAEPSRSSRGSLNSAHSRWLMSFPPAWCQAAILAHRKLQASKKSKRPAKPAP